MPFDGIWIDMNEPAAFGTNDDNPWYFNRPDHANTPPLFCPEPADNLDNPPYHAGVVRLLKHCPLQYIRFQGGRLYDKTLCMRGTQNNNQYQLYNTHNLFGWSEARATVGAMDAATPGKRGMIVSRSADFPLLSTVG
jgi:alpha-glucosidase (family GH31 glycosyl hydrolase)